MSGNMREQGKEMASSDAFGTWKYRGRNPGKGRKPIERIKQQTDSKMIPKEERERAF